MKKTVIILAIIVVILSLNKHEQEVRIPKEAIRFRIIANSNENEDQKLKKKIVKNLTSELRGTEKTLNIEETRNYIKKELPKFEEIINKTIKEENQEKTFRIEYGNNYFPKKVYKNVIYEEGEYESLVVTLGEGKGENFWCVLFPPLCFIEEESPKEYKSLIKEILDKYF